MAKTAHPEQMMLTSVTVLPSKTLDFVRQGNTADTEFFQSVKEKIYSQ